MAVSKQRQRRRGKPVLWIVLLIAAITLAGGLWFSLIPSRADLERAAIEAIMNHDLPKAEAALLRIRDQDQEVLRLLADVTYAQGRKSECLKWLEKLAERSGQSPALFCEAGAKAFEFARPVDAERLYRRAIQISPSTLEPYQRLARLYVAWQRGDELRALIVEADFKKVRLSDDPTLLWFWVVGDRIDWHDDASRRWLESVLIETPDEPYAATAVIRGHREPRDANAQVLQTLAWPQALATAKVAWESERIDDAIAILEHLPTEGERHAETWFLRGQIAEALEDPHGALVAYEYAVELDPLFVAPLYHRGHLLARLGKTAESQAPLRRALQLDEFVRKCVRFLQSDQTNIPDLLAIATHGLELGQDRWAQLVCQVIQRIEPREILQEPLKSLDSKTLAPLSLTRPGPSPQFTLKRSRHSDQPQPPIERETKVEQTSISFSDSTHDLELNFRYEYGHTRERWLMETLGGGVAVLDYDRDGWPDLFFAQGGSLSYLPIPGAEYGQLKRNLQGLKLADVTTVANAVATGYSHGCAAGDVDNDGFTDLLICRYGGVTLLMNQGDGTWSPSAIINEVLKRSSPPLNDPQSALTRSPSEPSNFRDKFWNTSAAFVDLDLDGQLDLYIAGYCHAPLSQLLRTCRDEGHYTPCRPSTYPAEPDTLLINTGTGTFENRSAACGIRDENGYGLGVIAADFDRDGLAEIFVGNDTTQNFLWHRDKPTNQPAALEFLELGLISGVAVDGSGRAEACMGIACGDIDGDERLDLFVTNFFDETCTFYQNLGNLQFEDRTQLVGLSNAGRQLMGWGCQFIDADNDGWLDLAILNGHLHDTPQLPQFYRNHEGHFRDRSSAAGDYFQQPRIGRAVATWDYNRDGRMDLVVSHQVEPAGVLRNDSHANHHLTLTLIGTKSARDATGAVITATVKNRKIVRLVSTQGGYLSACTSDVILGLGSQNLIDELEIDWPSGLHQRFHNVSTGRHLVVREGQSELIALSYQDDAK